MAICAPIWTRNLDVHHRTGYRSSRLKSDCSGDCRDVLPGYQVLCSLLGVTWGLVMFARTSFSSFSFFPRTGRVMRRSYYGKCSMFQNVFRTFLFKKT